MIYYQIEQITGDRKGELVSTFTYGNAEAARSVAVRLVADGTFDKLQVVKVSTSAVFAPICETTLEVQRVRSGEIQPEYPYGYD